MLSPASPFPLLQKLISKGALEQYGRFNKLKIIGQNLLVNVSIPKVRDMLTGSVARSKMYGFWTYRFPPMRSKKTHKAQGLHSSYPIIHSSRVARN
jgi:hypothetical protein